ncbi:hypothetical protein C8R45DRAFT_1111111 [Mycena sanguinolenta]|nr:hypothetical protein C8R45DRAFT_1111111 [Mycena sanguinolenta]
MPTLEALLHKAVESHIARPTYEPRLPAALDESLWPNSFRSGADDDGGATDRAYYLQVGAATLSHIIFLLLREELRGKPAGYSHAIQSAVLSQDALHGIMAKTDPRLVDGVKKVDVGFREYIGLLSTQTAADIPRLMRWLGPIFQPLIRTAEDAFLAYELKRKSKTVKKPARTPLEIIYSEYIHPDLIFLVRLREVQTDPKTPYSCDASSSGRSSPIASPERIAGPVSSPIRLLTPNRSFDPMVISPTASDIGRDLVEDGFLLYSSTPENLPRRHSKRDYRGEDEKRCEFETRLKLSPERSFSTKTTVPPKGPQCSPPTIASTRNLLLLGSNDARLHPLRYLVLFNDVHLV